MMTNIPSIATLSIDGLMDLEALMLKRVSLVGAISGPCDGLSLNDHAIYRDMLCTIGQKWQMEEMLTLLADSEIINMIPEQGGRNFLTEKRDAAAKTDLLVLCNIPVDTSGYEDLSTNADGILTLYAYGLNVKEQLALLRKSFETSGKHDDLAIWQQQIAASGAKFVFIYGADSFDPQDILPEGFVILPDRLNKSGAEAVLIRKDYLEAVLDYFIYTNKPLAGFASDVVCEEAPKPANFQTLPKRTAA